MCKTYIEIYVCTYIYTYMNIPSENISALQGSMGSLSRLFNNSRAQYLLSPSASSLSPIRHTYTYVYIHISDDWYKKCMHFL